MPFSVIAVKIDLIIVLSAVMAKIEMFLIYLIVNAWMAIMIITENLKIAKNAHSNAYNGKKI